MFTIDFFELAFLAEACIPPAPIARTMFWENLTDVYWDKMAKNERSHLHEWMARKDRYLEQLAEGNEYVEMFDARFNPDNQYAVLAYYTNQPSEYDCFLYNGRFHLNSRTSILDDFILNVKDSKGNDIADWKSLLNRL